MRFINSSGIVSAGIDWVTDSLWDHVEIQMEEGTYIGAHAGTGIQERSADYCKPSRERRYAVPVTDEQLTAIMEFARSKIGTPYDYLDIAGLFFHDRNLFSKSREICSMFVLEAAMAGNLQMLNVLPGFTHLITPETLHLSPLLIGNCTYDFTESS